MLLNCGAGKHSWESLDSKEIKPVNPKGNQPWILIGRTDTEAEAPVFWSSDINRQLIGKFPDAGKDWGWKEKRASENKMAGRITDAMNMDLGKLQEMVRDREAWWAVVHGVTKSLKRPGDWTTTTGKWLKNCEPHFLFCKIKKLAFTKVNYF